MDRSPGSDLELNRRCFLTLGLVSAVAASLPGRWLQADSAPDGCSPPIPQNHGPSNGAPCPYPIPWLDKNGNHNQSSMPNVELSNMYHFKGKLARCNGFHGMGTDNRGNPLAWGNPTTDYSLHGRGILGGAPGASRHLRPHVTDGIQGTGGPREPDSRFPSAHLARRAVLGHSGSGERPDVHTG
jgi:hypothetical protein